MSDEMSLSPPVTKHKLFRFADEAEKKAIERLSVELSALPETETVVLFGSRVRGDFSGSSDWDVLVVINDIVRRHNVIHVLHEIELEYEIPLSPIIYTLKEYAINKRLKSSFIANVEREGIVIYDTDRRG